MNECFGCTFWEQVVTIAFVLIGVFALFFMVGYLVKKYLG
jgi:hypothetical protein